MRILVTGGAGFIGSHLVRALVRDGHQVLNLDKLTYAGDPSSISDLEQVANHEFLRIDIADREAVGNAFGNFRPEVVMHLAAESHVDRSIDDPADFVKTNVVGTSVLLDAARDCWSAEPPAPERRFIHVSTDEVFGSLGETGRFSETSRYDPRSPYSASKAASDHLVRAWGATYGLPVIVTNSSNNYGPCQHPEKLVPQVILRAMEGREIPLYGSGRQVRDWLYVEDHVSALLAVLERGRIGATYLIGGQNELRNIDWVTRWCDCLDDEIPRTDGRPHRESIIHVADRPGHDFRYALDISKIRTELGWQPSHSIEEGIRKTVRWYREHPEAWRRSVENEGVFRRMGQPGGKGSGGNS